MLRYSLYLQPLLTRLGTGHSVYIIRSRSHLGTSAGRRTSPSLPPSWLCDAIVASSQSRQEKDIKGDSGPSGEGKTPKPGITAAADRSSERRSPSKRTTAPPASACSPVHLHKPMAVDNHEWRGPAKSFVKRSARSSTVSTRRISIDTPYRDTCSTHAS